MAAWGIHHASRLLRALRSQSRELWINSSDIVASARTSVGPGRPARALCLDWRARHRTIGTEHAAVAMLGPHGRATACAVVDELARVGRHGLRLGSGAIRTGNYRFKDHGRSATYAALRLDRHRPIGASCSRYRIKS